ncbi:PAS domain S-box protein [bacterium]|nr:PAS domain S-box protein [bacterium]
MADKSIEETGKFIEWIEKIRLAAVMLDPEGTIIFCNDFLLELIGRSREEVQGKDWFTQFIPKEIVSDIKSTFIKTIATGEFPPYYENEIITRNGDKLLIRWNNSVIRDKSGAVVCATSIGEDITEKRHSEDLLRESEKRYRELVELLPETVWETDMDGNLTFVSLKGFTLFGYTREDFYKGLNIYDLIHPDDRIKAHRNVRKVLEGKDIGLQEYSMLKKDGSSFPVMIHASEIIRDGKPDGLRGITLDVTEQVQAIRALRESEERFRYMTELSPFPVSIIDSTGRYIYMNKKFSEVFGYTPEDIPSGKAWFMKAFPDPEYRRNVIDTWKKDLKNIGKGKPRTRIFNIVCKDGSSREIIFRPVTMSDDNQFVTYEDITESRRAINALRREKEFSDNLINSSVDGILAFDREGVLTLWNQGMERISGVSKEETLGKCGFDIFPFLKETGEIKFFHETIAGNSVVAENRFFSVPITGKEGFFEGRYSPLRNEKGDIVGGITVVRDITERKRAEEHRRKLEEQLAQAQKMESIGRLAGGIAHDFNNLLTAIIGNSEIALMETSPDDSMYNEMIEIKSTAERAAELTRQLLAFSRRQIIEPRIINLNEIIFNMDKMIRRLIGENIELVLLPFEKLWSVKIDPGQLEQVLTNIAVNARDAMTEGGKLSIETSNITLDEESVKDQQYMSPGNYVMISVIDTGIGMDEETRLHIFEPFFTTKEVGKGTGLGMSTCYGIVKQNNGAIQVFSAPGKGTTVRLYFPRVSEKPLDVPRLGFSSVVPKGTETILVVEDEPSVRRMIKTILINNGYTVIDAMNGHEALRIIEHHNDIFQLLLTDVIMPGMGGKELYKALKKSYPDSKVLFMSGYTDDSIVHHGILDPGLEFIEKPFSPAALLKKVRNILDE